jgi:putative FmdB family regulatory protein
LPIYEFVCQQCRGLTELLVRNTKDKIEMKCSDCGSTELQRVVSRVNSVVADGSGQGADSAASPLQHRSCPSGGCSTITLPGHSRSS